MSITLETPHYALLKLNDTQLILSASQIIRDVFCMPNANLSELHKSVTSYHQLNTNRQACFNRINKELDWKKFIYESTYDSLKSFLGEDLSIQRAINLSIQIPGDSSSLLSAHIDPRSGDSPFQRVIWLPLTNAYGSNSMFIDSPTSGVRSTITTSIGDYLLFDSNCIHGNVVNETQETRISLNVRVKSWFAPDLGDIAPDRAFGLYYEDFVMTTTTLRGLNLYKQAMK